MIVRTLNVGTMGKRLAPETDEVLELLASTWRTGASMTFADLAVKLREGP